LSKIRVTFNRPVTWAEVETFKGFLDDGTGFYKWHFTEKRNALYIEDKTVGKSRGLYQAIADDAANFFVNLHPVAVRTFVD